VARQTVLQDTPPVHAARCWRARHPGNASGRDPTRLWPGRRAGRSRTYSQGTDALVQHGRRIPDQVEGREATREVEHMSKVNVDAQLTNNDSASLSRVDERLVAMQNG
jgi:hypothetical protein